jgi:outer membrane protein assembly factor BamB
VDVGEGSSSPVLAGGRAFVHSRRDPDELVTAIEVATGRILWQQKYTTPFNKNQYATNMSKGPHATPVVIGDRLFTLGGMAVLSAWEAESGKLAWRKDYSASVDTSKLFTGTAASPLAEDGALIVQVGSDLKGGRVIALNPLTGTERWTWTGKGPGYASPIAVTIGGIRQIVTLTNGSIEGIEARTGASLWSAPFPDEFHENIVSPVWTGTHLIASTSAAGLRGFTVRQVAGKWEAAEAWKNAEASMYMSTPVLADGVLYGLSNKKKGQIVAVDAATGALKWATEGRTADQAAILLTPAHVLALTTGGELVLVLSSIMWLPPSGGRTRG